MNALVALRWLVVCEETVTVEIETLSGVPVSM